MNYLHLNKYLSKIIEDYNDISISTLLKILNNNEIIKIKDIKKFDLMDLVVRCIKNGYIGFYLISSNDNVLSQMVEYWKNFTYVKDNIISINLKKNNRLDIVLNGLPKKSHYLCSIEKLF
jgi:hypothetical protein